MSAPENRYTHEIPGEWHPSPAVDCKVSLTKQNPHHRWDGGGCRINSLTMTYFHTGIRTIIGADSFHCPVRDGKEWDQVAMVVRLDWLAYWRGQ